MTRSLAVAIGCISIAVCVAAVSWMRQSTSDGSDVPIDVRNAVAEPQGAGPIELRQALPEHSDQPGGGLRQRFDLARTQPAGELRRAALIAVLSDGAASDPASAVQLAAELTENDGRDEALHETLAHWLRSAPDESRAWLRANADRLGGETTLVLSREAAALDPALALSLAQTLPIGLRSSGLSDVFAEWAALDPKQAAHAASQLSEKRDRRAALAEIGRSWGQSDARAAYEWARQLPDAEARRLALEPLIASWVESDPAAAARAAASAPPDLVRVRLLDRAASAWAERDVDAALQWAESLPEPHEREAAQTSVLLHLVQSRPEQAAERAIRSKENPEVVEKVLAAWDSRDRAAAQRWQEDHPLHAQR